MNPDACCHEVFFKCSWSGSSICSFINFWCYFLVSRSIIIVVFIIVFYRFKFDDERVTKEDMKRALEEQYGGEEEVSPYQH